MPSNPATSNSSEFRRTIVGAAALVLTSCGIYFLVMFAFLFEASKQNPNFLDFFLGPMFWWMWPPILTLNAVWIFTLVDAYRHHATTKDRVFWIAAVFIGQIAMCIVYWILQLRAIASNPGSAEPN